MPLAETRGIFFDSVMSTFSQKRVRGTAWAWIGSWRLLPYPPNQCDLPKLPGIYVIFGQLRQEHMKLKIVGRGGHFARIEDRLPRWITSDQKYPLIHAFYVGIGRNLSTRWEKHDKADELEVLMRAGITPYLAYWCMPVIGGSQETEETEESEAFRKTIERLLIKILCPLLCRQGW